MYYRKIPFHKKNKRNQKRMVYTLLRQSLFVFWLAIGLLFILAYLYHMWEFFFFSLFLLFFAGLFHLYRYKKRRELRKYYSIDTLQTMSPTHFELYVIELFNTLGYSLDWVGGSGDEGIDGVGTDAQGKSVILQTKRYADANKIQPTHIREFIGTLEYHNVDLGLYVTTGFATAGIHTYIREHRGRNIQFIDKDKLVELMIKAYSK